MLHLGKPEPIFTVRLANQRRPCEDCGEHMSLNAARGSPSCACRQFTGRACSVVRGAQAPNQSKPSSFRVLLAAILLLTWKVPLRCIGLPGQLSRTCGLDSGSDFLQLSRLETGRGSPGGGCGRDTLVYLLLGKPGACRGPLQNSFRVASISKWNALI